MARNFTRLTFTESVKSAQQHYGSRAQNQRMEEAGWTDDRLGPREADFIHRQDHFFMASVGEQGWPYVQYRGGPAGFLRVLDEKTLGFADYRGNLQYISTGNLQHDDRVALILLDQRHPGRLKILARARVLEAAQAAELAAELQPGQYPAHIERVVLYRVEAFDWNCPQHIIQRIPLAEVEKREEVLRERIRELESRLEAARS